MEKKKNRLKFLKNRTWKSKIANRLKGRADEICQEYLRGVIDRFYPIHVLRESRWKREGHE